ncbi:MAG TPA: double-strand break repair helicase AddA, partial [Alphaproteobacteria bacterium]|nr:double-strand break repair helicase AddA [Alphaproteobacteria bacterium]
VAKALDVLVADLGEWGFDKGMASILGDRARIAAAITKVGSVQKLVAHVRHELVLGPNDSSAKFRQQAANEKAFDAVAIKQAGIRLTEGGATCVKHGQIMLDWLALSAAERAARLDDYFPAYFTKEGTPFKTLVDTALNKKYPDLLSVLQQEVERLQLVRERIDAAQIAESTAAIITCGEKLVQEYDRRKREQGVLDYDDLIMRTDELLRREGIAPWILYKLDGGIDHILVDEAQDTSRAQWNIVKALTEDFLSGEGARTDTPRTLFVVGDEKQSIFSFQRADPEAFAGMKEYFSERFNEAEKTYREVPMQVSFRSATAVLQAVDAVFADDHTRSGVSAVAIKHQAHKKEKVGRVEFWKVDESTEKEKEDTSWVSQTYEDEHDEEAELAARIADKISSWLKSGERLPGADTPITPGDIMVLLRKRGRFADLMVRALKQRKVAVTGVDRMCLIKQLPVMDLLAVMQFVLLPEDDLNLATVLRGPLLGLSEEHLMTLAIGRGKKSLWQSLTDKIAESPNFSGAHGYLEQWLGDADFQSPLVMLTRLLSEPCPGNAVSGRRAIWSRLGLDALDPIDELLNSAQDFSHRHAPSLQNFLHWLTATEAEIKRELDHGDKAGGGQVRIMTVHASKGLEAPIVFLPDTASMPRANDIARLLWTDDDVPLYIARTPLCGTAFRLRQRAWQKQMEEYRRLMYVALTRSASHLYIAGWKAKNWKNEDNWYNLIQAGLKPHDQPSAHEGGEEIVIADPILKSKPTKSESAKAVSAVPTLPDWARQNAPEEITAYQRVSPSRHAAAPAVATPDIVFGRGRIIHRLLESLPDIADNLRDKAAERFLSNPEHRLTSEQQAEIKNEVLAILRNPEFAPLFGPESRAEVPLVGRIGKQEIPGRVDRLSVLKDEIWIVDYKTNRPPPADVKDIPEPYRLQLANYSAVLKEIYPGRRIRCFLLWTYKPFLMPVPESLLTSS